MERDCEKEVAQIWKHINEDTLPFFKWFLEIEEQGN